MKHLLSFLILISPLSALADLTAEVGAYSNFVWRGTTFSENKPALQGYLEFEEAHGFFIGGFASNAEFSDEALGKNSNVTQETDITIGKRWVGKNWELQIMYGKFLFPNADVFNTDELNFIGTYKNIFLELSYMDDYFGYQSTYKYVRLGYKWEFNESLESTLSIGHNAFNRPKGNLKSRCLDNSCSEVAYTTTGAGNPDYIDVYLVNQKTLDNEMITQLALNWTNRHEYLADSGGIIKEKAKDFAIIVALIIPFGL